MIKNILRVVFILTISFNFGFAKDKEGATKADIKVLIELIKSNQESTNKRFEDMQKYMDKRFEAVDRRFDDVNRRFDDVNRRFDDVNKRFEFMQSLLFALLASIFGLIGYSIYDRKKVIKDSKDEFEKIIEERLVVKADKKALDKVISIIENLAKVDEKVKNILNNHNLAFKG